MRGWNEKSNVIYNLSDSNSYKELLSDSNNEPAAMTPSKKDKRQVVLEFGIPSFTTYGYNYYQQPYSYYNTYESSGHDHGHHHHHHHRHHSHHDY